MLIFREYEPLKKQKMITLVFALLSAFVSLASPQQQAVFNHNCPQRPDIAPCVCYPRKNGLHIACEYLNHDEIANAMSVLKGKGLIIYYLKLRHNKIPKLPGYIFFGLDINHLTIHNCSLAVVQEEALSSVGKMLTQLDLSQNKLTSVPSEAYKNLHHLFLLNMNFNKIATIHARAFQGLDTLEILTLYENEIVTVDDEAFFDLGKNLKRLNLGGNNLTHIPHHALNTLESLKKLELQENNISEVRADDFKGLKNLDSLGLTHNKLKQLPAGVFQYLTSLNSLEVEGNEITYIDQDAFKGVEDNLQYLRLGDNLLHTIPSDALRSLRKLRHLDLRSNSIESIQEDAFLDFGQSITFLNLQKNNIKILPALSFETLTSLETLNLQNNKLTHIPPDVMDLVADTLTSLDITGNPLLCNCELLWYKDWLRNLRDKDDDTVQKKRITCYMEKEGREYALQKLPVDKMGCIVVEQVGKASSNRMYWSWLTFIVLASNYLFL